MKKTIKTTEESPQTKQVRVRCTTDVVVPVSVFNYDYDGKFIMAPSSTPNLFVHIEQMAEDLGLDAPDSSPVEQLLWECGVVENIVELELDVL